MEFKINLFYSWILFPSVAGMHTLGRVVCGLIHSQIRGINNFNWLQWQISCPEIALLFFFFFNLDFATLRLPVFGESSSNSRRAVWSPGAADKASSTKQHCYKQIWQAMVLRCFSVQRLLQTILLAVELWFPLGLLCAYLWRLKDAPRVLSRCLDASSFLLPPARSSTSGQISERSLCFNCSCLLSVPCAFCWFQVYGS